jgi:cell wall assembly regulator SMI1
MKNTLQEISKLALQLGEFIFTDEQKKLKWLGEAPASIEEIEIAENRLGIQFPEDYKDLLLITNGFFTPCDSTEPTFERVENIDYLENIDAFLLEVWNKGPLADVGEQLKRAVVIAGLNDEQYFLLIPPSSSLDKWQYWKFANWIPGEQRYESLVNYFDSVLDFLKSLIQS